MSARMLLTSAARHEVIILVNALVMLMISMLSTSWVHIYFDFKQLLPKLRHNTAIIRLENDPQPHLDTMPIYRVLYVHTRNRTYNLYNKHSNLFQECSDLIIQERRRLRKNRAIRSTDACVFMPLSGVDILSQIVSKSNQSREPYTVISVAHRVSFVLACATTLVVIVSMLVGPYASIMRSLPALMCTAVCTCLSGILYVATIITCLVKMHLMRVALQYETSHDGNDRSVDHVIRHAIHVTPGWSLAAAALSCVLWLAVFCIYTSNALTVRVQRRNTNRRRRLQTAIMSACRNDMALVVRARMTVL